MDERAVAQLRAAHDVLYDPRLVDDPQRLLAEAATADALRGPLGALRYVRGPEDDGDGFPGNPNGSFDDLAGITDPSGLVLGLMPHPEDAVLPLQQPAHERAANPLHASEGSGLALFRAGVALAAAT